ncbi:MAG TPA: NADPH:quinone reductase, partial [Candidatus Acidoferrum sp.]
MKAIQVHQFGGPEVLQFEEIPTPKPAAGQVLVRVHGAGVNPYDTYMRNGTYAIKPPLPYTPGSDAAGVIEAVGEGVTKLKPGARVYTARTVTGAYAEYTLALESQVHPLPEKISFSQGAGVWVPYGTAITALVHHAQARPGETVLIHGASGGVGTAAAQFARAIGMTVFGTAGTQKGMDLAKKEGAHQVFDHSKAGYAEEITKAT